MAQSNSLKFPAPPRVGPKTVASALLIMLAVMIIRDIFRRRSQPAPH
jgi:hypothetical protein